MHSLTWRFPGQLRSIPEQTSMPRWRRTGLGWMWVPTGVAGIRLAWKRTGGPTARATGNTPTAVGTGKAMSRGRGLVIIMVRGSMIHRLGGFGFRTSNGRRPGFRGARARVTLVGRRCRRGTS